MSSVHIKPEEFKNGGFTRITHQMFFIHTTLEEFKNAKIAGHTGFVFEKTPAQIPSDYCDAIVSEKLRF